MYDSKKLLYRGYFSTLSIFRLRNIKGFFNREYVKSDRLPKDMGRLFNKAFEYRQKFDCVNFVAPEESMVVEYINKTQGFCDEIRKFIKANI